MLYALEVPPAGGNTSFCSMYAIYDALPAALKDAHRETSSSSTTAPTTAAAMCARASRRPTIRALRRVPCIRWSARIRRPAGACSISAAGATPILEGSSSRESEALLDELWSYVDRAGIHLVHVWRVGDLVLWDNRCTMHRRDPFDPIAPDHASHPDQGRATTCLSAARHSADKCGPEILLNTSAHSPTKAVGRCQPE